MHLKSFMFCWIPELFCVICGRYFNHYFDKYVKKQGLWANNWRRQLASGSLVRSGIVDVVFEVALFLFVTLIVE